jgi:hypothetical protein
VDLKQRVSTEIFLWIFAHEAEPTHGCQAWPPCSISMISSPRLLKSKAFAAYSVSYRSACSIFSAVALICSACPLARAFTSVGEGKSCADLARGLQVLGQPSRQQPGVDYESVSCEYHSWQFVQQWVSRKEAPLPTEHRWKASSSVAALYEAMLRTRTLARAQNTLDGLSEQQRMQFAFDCIFTLSLKYAREAEAAGAVTLNYPGRLLLALFRVANIAPLHIYC